MKPKFDRWPDAKRQYKKNYRDCENHTECAVCGDDMPCLCVVHHVDCNPSNNAKVNLLPVCWSCHRRLHAFWPNWRYLTNEEIARVVRTGMKIIGIDNIDAEKARLKERVKNRDKTIKILRKQLTKAQAMGMELYEKYEHEIDEEMERHIVQKFKDKGMI